MGDMVMSARAAGWYRDPPGGYEYGYWDGSAWRPDVSAAMHVMQASSIEKYFIGRRALARIGEFVPSDETVVCIGAGSYYSWGNRPVALVLTDRRLLLLIGGRRRADVRGYPLESISFAGSRWGGLTVIANGKKLRIECMNVHDRDEIARAIRDRLSGRHPGPAPAPRRVWDDLGKITRWRVTEE